MKLSRGLWLFILFALSAAGAARYYLYQAEQAAEGRARAEQEQAVAQMAKALAEQQARLLAERTRPLADRAMQEAVPATYPRPPSQWKDNEKAIYQKLLSAGQFDILVVPFQVQEYAFDRATRSLMTAELSLAIAAGQKQKMPDPYLVARALGGGDRRLDRAEVDAFAEKIGAKKIIWGYVGHDRNRHMALSIQVQDRAANGTFAGQPIPAPNNFENIAFSDEHPPFEAYQAILPDVLKAIGVDGTAWAAARPLSQLAGAPLPAAPLAMISEKPEPARDALYFQLFAALTPNAAQRAKELFAEKSMLALLGMSPDSPEYRVLKARAYMLLSMRPAALQTLGEPKTSEAQELFALLNGNLPAVEAAGGQVKSGVFKVVAKLDANYLNRVYANIDKSQSLAAAASLKLPGQIWPFLAARAFADGDMWAQFENIYLKQLLDHEFPIKDFTADSIIRGARSLGDASKLQVTADLSVMNHIRKLFEMDPATWSLDSATVHPSKTDYLNLIEAIGNDDLMRRADFLTQLQRAPERTLAYLEQIESVYKGYPEFTLARAEAEVGRANVVEGLQKEGLMTAAYKDFFDVMYWEQGQSFLSADAFNEFSQTGRRDYGPLLDNFFASDYPFRPYYPTWEHGGMPSYQQANAELALKNSIVELTPLRFLDWLFSQGQDDKREALYKSIEGRFVGNPQIYQMRAQSSLDKGDTQAAAQFYRECVKLQPEVWEPYLSLGTLLISDGQMQAADKLFLSYPGFKQSAKSNPVGISNNAYEAASKFYWLGEFSLAMPLYQVASRRETGSAADLTAQQRLRMFRGDYRGALAYAQERARHYNEPQAYRDYIALLHVMGAPKDAWAAFDVVVPQMTEPHVWESALVGHRLEGKSETEIAEWVKQKVAQNVGKQANHAAKYLMRAGVTDRTPSKEFAAALTAVAQPAWKLDYSAGSMGGMVVQPLGDGQQQEVLGPRTPSGSVLPLGVFDAFKKTAVKPGIVYFAEAYRAIRTADFAAARAEFQEETSLYDLSLSEFGYALPYYAFASARAGDTVALEKYLAEFSSKQKGFDYQLAKAVISGMGGAKAESVELLKRALYSRPFTDERALQPEYEYAEICEWLYEATGYSRYRDLALDWAQKNQKFHPWFAWAYAMEAVLSGNREERHRAMAMAHYLDPHSEMLSRVPEAELKQAVQEFRNLNPFLVKDKAIQPQI